MLVTLLPFVLISIETIILVPILAGIAKLVLGGRRYRKWLPYVYITVGLLTVPGLFVCTAGMPAGIFLPFVVGYPLHFFDVEFCEWIPLVAMIPDMPLAALLALSPWLVITALLYILSRNVSGFSNASRSP